jgi:hypothetical protein
MERTEVLDMMGDTDFAAMSADWIDRLSRRGEQLTRALIAECELLRI